MDEAIASGAVDRIARGRPSGLHPLMTALLQRADVIDGAGGLTSDFATVWTHPHLVTARVRFLRRAASDVLAHLGSLTADLPSFMEQAETFRLFDYAHATGTDPEDLAATQAYADYLAALTAVEVPLLVPLIGPITGAMAGALRQANPEVEITVLDLPAVCHLGREAHPDVSFDVADLRDADAFGAWAGQADGILFKSVLHDWPDAQARAFLSRAADALAPGGRIVIAERGSFLAEIGPLHFADVANLVFAPFYRDPDTYADWLAELGFELRRESVQIDMTFHVLTGVRA